MPTGPHLFSLPETRTWRVKLYRLTSDAWKEFGVGLLSGRGDADGDFALLVRDARDTARLLFHSRIRAPVAFQKQETLLLWHGPESDVKVAPPAEQWFTKNGSTRIAIGFEVPAACTIITDFILYAIAESEAVQSLLPPAERPDESGQLASVRDQPDGLDSEPGRPDADACSEQSDDAGLCGTDDDDRRARSPRSSPPLLQSGTPAPEGVDGDGGADSNGDDDGDSDSDFNGDGVGNGDGDMHAQGGRGRVSFAVQHANQGSEQERYAEVIDAPFVLPPLPAVDNLDVVAHTASELLNSRLGREFLVVFFDLNDYLSLLWRVHTILAADEPVQGLAPQQRLAMLWAASDIVKIYAMLGDVVILDRMTDNTNFFKVLSILEYDRAFGARRAEFCAYGERCACAVQVVRHANPQLGAKLSTPCRLNLLHDILTRSSADDFSYHVLKTLAYVHFSGFLEDVCEEPRVFESIFNVIRGAGSGAQGGSRESLKAKHMMIQLVATLIRASRSVNANQSHVFYQVLIENGLLDTFENSLCSTDLNEVKVLALESITAIAESNMHSIASFEQPLLSGLIYTLLEDVPRSQVNPSAKALQIQAYSLFKTLSGESPIRSISRLFERINDVLLNPRPDIIMGQLLLSILQIVTFCYADTSEVVCETMERLGSWPIITNAQLFDRKDISPHTQSQLAMHAIRLMRVALVSGCQLLGCEEANNLSELMIGSRFLPQVIQHIVKVRHHVNAEEHSTSLSWFYALLDAYKQREKSACTIVKFMIADIPGDLRALVDTYPIVESFLTETRLKRPVSETLGDGGQKQRPRVAPQEFFLQDLREASGSQ